MKIKIETNQAESTVELSFQELVDIIKGRQKHAHIDPIMSDGSENYLSVCHNDGVDLMARYLLDWFGNEYDKKAEEIKTNWGNW